MPRTNEKAVAGRLPQLLTLGEYCPVQRVGPAIWLRTLIDQLLAQVEMPEGATPIVYLPSVSRQALRAVQECPGPSDVNRES